MNKAFKSGTVCKEAIKNGTSKVAEYVGVTLGPKGENVLIEIGGDQIPKLTKDGVSVARQIRLEDPYENAAAMSLIEVSLKMLERVGDGTTTAILFAEALIDAMLENDLSQEDKEKILSITNDLIDRFKTLSIDALDEDILAGVANISSNGDKEITELLKEAISHVGKDGHIIVEVDQSLKTRVIPEKGFYLPYGFNTFNLPNQKVSDYKDPYLVLYEDSVNSFSCMENLLSQHAEKEALNPIVVIANHFSQDALLGVMQNVLGRRINMAAISLDDTPEKCASFMQDLSKLTGCPIFGGKYDKKFGTEYNRIHYEELKRVASVRIKKDSTLVIPTERQESDLAEHLSNLTYQLENTDQENERVDLKERIARLSQTIAVIKIGGLTHQTTMEKKDRIEDAVCAVLQAREHGVLPGGGLPMVYAFKTVYENYPDSAYRTVLMQAFSKLLKKLYSKTSWAEYFPDTDNLWMIPYNKIQDILPLSPTNWCGLNISTDEEVSMFDECIFDPTSVIINTLQTGVAAALNLMNTGVIMINSRKVDPIAMSMFANPMLGAPDLNSQG